MLLVARFKEYSYFGADVVLLSGPHIARDMSVKIHGQHFQYRVGHVGGLSLFLDYILSLAHSKN